MPNSYDICMYMKALHMCALKGIRFHKNEMDRLLLLLRLLLDKLMLFSQCRATATWTPQTQTLTLPPPKEPSLCQTWRLPYPPPLRSLHPTLRATTTQRSPLWSFWACRWRWRDWQHSWRCADPQSTTRTRKRAVAQESAWLVAGVDLASHSSKCGRDWVHIDARAISLSGGRPNADRMSRRARTHHGPHPDKRCHLKPACSPISLCHVCLTLSLKSDWEKERAD